VVAQRKVPELVDQYLCPGAARLNRNRTAANSGGIRQIRTS
jgi:hypothetical protein